MQSTDGELSGYKVLMKKLISLALVIALLELPTSAKALEGLINFPNKKDSTVFLEVAVTSEQKEKGLMNRPGLASNRGMVFIFKPARKVTFWMKDTLIPLDMIFINNGTIVKIVKNAVPNQTSIIYPSDFDVTEVVEVNGGFSDSHNLQTGDKVIFENISYIDYSKKSKLTILNK